jgi:hypothetical protein
MKLLSKKYLGQAEDGLDRTLNCLGLEMPIAEPQCWLESAIPARERKQVFRYALGS